jgi:hypothetical protein
MASLNVLHLSQLSIVLSPGHGLFLVVGAIVPGLERHPLKKLAPEAENLLQLQKAHAGQSVGLADAIGRGVSHAAERRGLGRRRGGRVRRALPHGHAAAVLGSIRWIGLDRLLSKPRDKGLAPLGIALIASRVIAPASKLATARELAAETAGSSSSAMVLAGMVLPRACATPPCVWAPGANSA